MTETETVITREEIEETMITERTTKEKVKAEAEVTTEKRKYRRRSSSGSSHS